MARLGSVGAGICALVTCGPLAAASPRGNGDLASVLATLESDRHLALLYDRALVSGLKSGPYHRTAPVDQALFDILRGTGLVAVRTGSGAYVIRRDAMRPPVLAVAPVLSPMLVADILVVGRATSNIDLPRSEDDIQPYHVLSASRIDASLAHSTAELLSEQLTMNVAAPGVIPTYGTGNYGFYVDLNGVGASRTLITVDGRRLPGFANNQNFQQADIGAISPDAIERVETLGLAAGAIFGVGATGGVVNVVLKHDYAGFDMNVVNGISARGDDAQHVVEAKAGFESQSGRTKALVRVSYMHSGGDLLGSRPVGRKYLELIQKDYPTDIYIVGNAISYRSADGAPLQFLPDYGGATLGALSTWLPLNAPALTAGGADILRANAGHPITEVSPDAQGGLQSLVPKRNALSVVASARQAVGSRVELYADALLMRDTQNNNVASIQTIYDELYPGEVGNPFNNTVYASYPMPGLVGHSYGRQTTDRETLGAIVRLWSGWSAVADFSRGEAVAVSRAYGSDQSPLIDLTSGAAGLASELGQFSNDIETSSTVRNRLYDANGRIAGPLFMLPGGRATLTLAGEWQQDHQPDSKENFSGYIVTNGYQRESVGSASAEARFPIISTDMDFAPWRGLKVQIATRYDRYSVEVPGDETAVGEVAGFGAHRLDNHDAVASFTLGASVEPTSGLMLRASYADGYEPPSPDQIVPRSNAFPLYFIADPKRGGAFMQDDGYFLALSGGSPTYKAQRTRALSFGIVLKPDFGPGLRFSVDYSRLLVTRALTDFAQGDLNYFLQHEADYPGRVVRAPLSAADQALGYTGGLIQEIDTSSLPIGRNTIQTLEFALDYHHALGSGQIGLFARADWEPRFTERTDPDYGSPNLAGLLVGPLKLRANAGIGWASDIWSAQLEARYYGSYRTADFNDSLTYAQYSNATTFLVEAPGLKIPGKAYLDLALGYTSHIAIGSRSTTVRYRLAVRDLLDKAALPLPTDYDVQQADPYSDLVGRRFELGISASF